jgi:hypothetical protein
MNFNTEFCSGFSHLTISFDMFYFDMNHYITVLWNNEQCDFFKIEHSGEGADKAVSKFG